MSKIKIRKFVQVMALSSLVTMGGLGVATAATSSSANYSVTETQFGSGAELNACSASYCAKQSAGDTAVGSAKSTNYSAQFGFNTTPEPYLEVSTSGGNQDMGVLDNTKTGTATNLIKVRNYLSSGYVMQITGNTPSQGTHALVNLVTPTTSHQGAEQFGINLMDNSAPDIGANTVQVPSNIFSFGVPTADYGTADLFKYINGDIVAQSASSSGETDYTLSMIINVSNVTPGGKYTGALSAVVTPIF